MSWTGERTEKLKSLWAKGFSAQMGADELAVTRNAAIRGHPVGQPRLSARRPGRPQSKGPER